MHINKVKLVLAATFLILVVFSFYFLFLIPKASGTGKSMMPTFTPGSDHFITYTTNIPDTDLTGKIIYFVSPYLHSDFLVHRVIEDNRNTLITKGDNNSNPDPEIKRSDIIGIVTGYYPSWVLLFFSIVFGVALFGFLVTVFWHSILHGENHEIGGEKQL